MKKLKFRNDCIIELMKIHFAHTYVIANRLRMRKVIASTSDVLANMKQLEKDGYARGIKEGLGYKWSLTDEGINRFKVLANK